MSIAASTDLVIRPLTPGRWKDLEALFASKGCSIPRGCWCMFYRETGKTAVPPGRTLAEDRNAKLRALCNAGPPPGRIAYASRKPVGWVTLGPRADFLRLRRSPIMKPVDDAQVWSIVCFVVPPEFRHRGVAHALLRGAIDYAKKRGARILEAYPVDKSERGNDDWMWHGAKSMFDKAGFTEVARRKPQRPVMRIELYGARGR
jgi:ribosomal protein S18 acetylase RimI-like enzyme